MAVSAWSASVTATTPSGSGFSDWSSTVTATTLAAGLGAYINNGGVAVGFIRWRKTSGGKQSTTLPSSTEQPPPPPPPPPPDPDPTGSPVLEVPTDAGYVDVTKSPYNVVANSLLSASANTAGLLAAFQANDWKDATGGPHVDKLAARTILLPEGTVYVNDGFEIPGSGVRIMGRGESLTTLRLVDNSAGFGSAGSPKYVLRGGTAMDTNQDNSGFANYLMYLTIDVGSGNPGAVAYRFAAANVGAVRHVTLKCTAATKAVRGLTLESTTGPCAVFDLTIDGFTTGVWTDTQAVNDIVFGGLTIKNCTTGILNQGKSLAIEDLVTTSTPRVYNATDNSACLILARANVSGTSAQPAFQTTSASYMWVRDVTAASFPNLVTQGATTRFSGATSITEWATHNYRKGNTSQAWASTGNVYVSLNLPHTRAPEYHNTDLSQWVNVRDMPSFTSTNVGPALQDAIDSGAKVVYLPYAQYALTTDVFVRGAVRKIDFCFSAIDGNGGDIIVNSVSDGIVEISSLSQTGLIVTQNGASDLVYRDVGARTGYSSTTSIPGTPTINTGASATGDIYLENFGARGNMQISRPINVWARQWNRERVPMNISGGAKVWVMGDNIELHSNYGRADINVSGSSQLELLGGAYDVLNYAGAYPTSGRAVTAATNSKLFIQQPSAQRSGTIGHWVSDTVSGALVGDVNSSQTVQSVTGSSNNRVIVSYVSP